MAIANDHHFTKAHLNTVGLSDNDLSRYLYLNQKFTTPIVISPEELNDVKWYLHEHSAFGVCYDPNDRGRINYQTYSSAVPIKPEKAFDYFVEQIKIKIHNGSTVLTLSNQKLEKLHQEYESTELIGGDRFVFVSSGESYKLIETPTFRKFDREIAMKSWDELDEIEMVQFIDATYPHEIAEKLIKQLSDLKTYVHVTFGETYTRQYISEFPAGKVFSVLIASGDYGYVSRYYQSKFITNTYEMSPEMLSFRRDFT